MKVKLTEICDFQGGSQPPKDEWSFEKQDGYIRMLQIRDFTQSERVIPEYIKISNSTKICEEDDILIARYGASIGKILTGLAGAYNVAIMRTIPDTSKVKKRYLYYYLKSNYFQNAILNVGSRAAQAGFNKEDLGKLEINCPSLSKQEEIINVLYRIETIIENRKRELMHFDSLIKARFVELFDLSLCERRPLGECTDFIDYRGHTPELSDKGTIRMVNAKSVGKGYFKYIDEYITEETYDSWMHRGFGYPGDVLFVTEGHTFGNTCMIPNDMKKFALGQRVITIQGHAEIKNAFLCSYMQTEMFWRDINVYRTGGTAQGIRSKDLVKVLVPIPPLEQQEQFMDFVKQVDKSKVAVQKALDEAQLLFDSLMQKYFG